MDISLRYRPDASDPIQVKGDRIWQVISLLRSFVEEEVERYLQDNPELSYHPSLKIISRAKSNDFLSHADLEDMREFIQAVVTRAVGAYNGEDNAFADGVRANAVLASRITNEYFHAVYELSGGRFPLLGVRDVVAA